MIKERSYEVYCPITQAWRVQCPISSKISLVITMNHVREFCYGFAEVMSSNPAQAWIFSGLMFTTAQVVFIKAKIAFNYSHTITWLVFFSLSGVSHSRTEIKNSCNYCCIKSKLTWYSYSFTMHDGWPSWCILYIQCFCFVLKELIGDLQLFCQTLHSFC